MSGGHFNYSQYKLLEIAEEIGYLIERSEDPSDFYGDLSSDTIHEFRNAIFALEEAYAYVQRIDWLVCADDSEETFHQRLQEDLRKVGYGR